VFPSVHIHVCDPVSQNPIRILIASAIITKKQQGIERHIELWEVQIASELQIVADDPCQRLDAGQAVTTFDAIRFQKQFAQLVWQRNLESDLRGGDLFASSRRCRLARRIEPYCQVAP